MIVKKQIELLGERVFYFEKDLQKPTTIVFVHGFNSNSKFMSALLDLETEYNIVALDMPGNGKTSCNSIPTVSGYQKLFKAFIDFLPYDNIIALGHSLGGASVAYAANKCKKIKKIILLSAINPFTIKNDTTRALMRRLLLPQNEDDAEKSIQNLIYLGENNKEEIHKTSIMQTIQILRQINSDEEINAEKTSDDSASRRKRFIANIRPMMRSLLNLFRSSHTVFKTMIDKELLDKKFLENDILNLYMNVKKPILMIHGIKDHYVSISAAKKLAEILKTKLIIIDNCGHAPIYEFPQLLNTIFNNFITNKLKIKQKK